MASEGPPADTFRILSVDGGGIRGLIPALVIAELESRLRRLRPCTAISACFHLMAGTSTGGLIALGLTVPDEKDPERPRLKASDLMRLYREEGPEVFRRGLLRRILSLDGWL